jgi:hypothetical protein
MDKAGTSSLASPAWLLRGISAIPGQLRLSRSVLTFTAHGSGTAWAWQLRKLERSTGRPGLAQALESDERWVVFSEALDAIRVSSPWYYFAGGIVVRIGPHDYRISFGKPARSSGDDDGLDAVSDMRRLGKQWMLALGVA